MLMARMQSSGFPFGRVVCVGGSGQQHGSVYWKKGSSEVLANLTHTLPLHSQLQVCNKLFALQARVKMEA